MAFRIGLQPSNQFTHVLRRKRFSSKEKNRRRSQRRDRREIIQHVVWKRIESAVHHMSSHKTSHYRVSISSCTSRPASADAAVRPANPQGRSPGSAGEAVDV